MAVFCSGCASTGSTNPSRDNRDPINRDTAQELFAEPNTAAGNLETQWAVLLAIFRGPTAMDLARQGADKVNAETRLTARVQRRGDGEAAVAVGSFGSPGEQSAQRMLRRVRETRVEGTTPFTGAFLAPPPSNASQGTSTDPLDLRSARAAAPSAEYTLEIAVYARTDGGRPTASELADFRRAAREAAQTLRSEGSLAFYYNGPNSSSVTVGLFTAGELATGDNAESARLSAARQAHPNLLVNGAGQRRRVTLANGQSSFELDPSRLVAVPK